MIARRSLPVIRAYHTSTVMHLNVREREKAAQARIKMLKQREKEKAQRAAERAKQARARERARAKALKEKEQAMAKRVRERVRPCAARLGCVHNLLQLEHQSCFVCICAQDFRTVGA